MIKRLFPLMTLAVLLASCTEESTDIVYTKSGSPYHIMTDLEIGENQNWIVEPGVEIIIYDAVVINVSSDVIMEGTEDEPIIISPETPGVGWDKISLKGPAEKLVMSYVEMTDGILTSYSTDNAISNCTFINTQDLDWQYAILRFWYGSLSVMNCDFTGVNKAEGVLMHDVNDPVVGFNSFYKVPDAIELISGIGGEFYNNTIIESADDGIDLNACVNTVIRNNYFRGIGDAAMEIGSENFGITENAMVMDNYITECSKGIWLKESSTAHVLRDTFVMNGVGVDVITEEGAMEVSEIILEHCIFMDNQLDTLTDSRSIITVIN